VILICKLKNSAVYQWTVPGLLEGNNGVAIIDHSPTLSKTYDLSFGRHATRISTTSTKSTLTFKVTTLLSGKNITCKGEDTALAPAQSLVIFIPGMP